MRRGTTPTHTYTLLFDGSEISKLSIVYTQSGKSVLRKTEQDVTIDGNTIRLRLTQEETLGFSSGSLVEIQMKVLLKGGDALVSDVWSVHPSRCLDDEVL